MIKAVLFDYGGVLSPGGRSLATVFSKLLNLPADAIDIDELHIQFRRGDISAEDFFIELSEKYGKPVTAEEFITHSDIFVKNQKVYELAEQLRQHGIKTGILSNVYKLSADILRKDGYYDGFDPLILSCQERSAKPEPEIYQIALERLGLPADQVLFIDDQDKCFPPAQAIGIHTIKAESEDQTVADIKALLQKENGLQL